MQALVLDGINQPLQLRDVPPPSAGPGELLVQVHAAALNHRDVWIQKGQYAGLRFPCILGSDGAGLVSAVGEGVSADWLGQKVLINPGHNWGENPRAQGKAFTIVGLPEQGTFAEYLRVPAQYVHPMPPHLTFAQAAALPLAGVTAYRAVFTRAGLQANERVLVTGIGGGVALLAMQMAVARGAQVWVTSGSEEKIARAVALGAQGGINYKTEGWAMALAKEAGGPFDVIVDSAAGPAFAQLVDVAAAGGRIVFYGGTLGAIPQLPPAKIFWKQLSILGSTMGTEQDFAELLALVTEHQLKPVVDEVLPLDEGESAMRRMDNGQQFGKIVLQIMAQ
ncbi:zinc-binding alcohol dehydrogenase family protein [Hymenobacter sp. DG25A]|uniref:quinone oxidoreductase family protein n=1 Tax=Hymenobacter sp. DG25A TaxID=1385663 RepID=UPI0006BD6E5F|nr:zinc-binding dehydrogenase [Hymenobacter sp. DG25A]ALD20398.1 alcohol dehydrogenase [Hymenobacter sp. DG25A]